MGTKKTCNFSGQKKIKQPLWTKKNVATSQDKKKSHNLLEQKKHTTSWDQKNYITSWDKKIPQPLGRTKSRNLSKKRSCNLLGQKNHTTSRDKKTQASWDKKMTQSLR